VTGPEARSPARHKIPERSGEVLIDPPLDRIPSLLAAARDSSCGDANVLGMPLGEFRRRAQTRALDLAGVPAGAGRRQGAAWIVMGHQPLFFHPGVWMKYFLLTQLCADPDVTGLHLVVDSDAPGSLSAPIPAREERFVRRTETLLALAGDMPLEGHRPPTAEQWQGFCQRVRAHLATLAVPDISARFEAFVAEAEPALHRSVTLAAFLARMRRCYEARAAVPRYLEVAVSTFAETEEFRRFALHLLQTPHELLQRYNANLDRYRGAHRLRSPANPFPNLGQANGFQETPFWIVREGRRADLYAAREGDRLRLRAAQGPIIDVPAGAGGVDALASAGVAIRPKAITLTMFARLCVGDLFIHGVGGGSYDRVTDALASEVFGCTPCPYVVATATLYLPLLGEGAAPAEGRALERRLMELRHNPERYLDTSTDAVRRLVDEKWGLIRAVQTMRPGKERRAATHRIRELNVRLADGLVPEIDGLQARLAAADRASAVRDAVEYRGYPFFLFDPAAVAALAGIVSRSA
jgi:hypothetical protein